uniref:CHK kinase-like domain-containing protein n=1 Tax=viral metagenome TaxID=1070528 RepID=A0A6C0JXI4_9ZZZZ
MFVCIPLGGTGQRFKECGYTGIKPLIPVNGKPILYYLLSTLSYADLIYIPYNKDLPDFEKTVRLDFPDLNFIFFPVTNTRGAAETVYLALSHYKAPFDSPILCLDGDSWYNNFDIYTDWNGKDKLYFIESNNPAYSYLQTDETGEINGRITDIVEKRVISDKACTGAYGFSSWKTLLKHAKNVVENANNLSTGEPFLSLVVKEMIPTTTFVAAKAHGFTNMGTPKDIINFYNIQIAFDLDGTLVDTEEAYFNTWKEMHPEITLDWYNKNIKGKSDKQVPLDSSKKDIIFKNHLHLVKEIPGSKTFIRECLDNNITCTVVTNSNRSTAESLTFLPIVSSEDCPRQKPWPDPYLKAKLTDKLTIAFEDTPTGIQSARAAGFDVVIGLTTSCTDKVLCNHGADFCIQNFNIDIHTIMRKIEDIKSATKYIEKECQRILRQPVTIEKQLLKGGYIANVQRVKTDKGTYILKRESENSHNFSKMSRQLLLYDREYYFYSTIAKHLTIKTPGYIGTIYNPNGEKKGILLEYLGDNFTFSQMPTGTSMIDDQEISNLELLIKRVAEMHRTDISQFDLMRPCEFNWHTFCETRWSKFEEKWKNIIDTSIGRKILANYKNIENILSQPPFSLVHGDVKIPNIAMHTSGEPYFLDWQYIIKGKGIQDIAFLLVESFELEQFDDILYLYRKMVEIPACLKKPYAGSLSLSQCGLAPSKIKTS